MPRPKKSKDKEQTEAVVSKPVELEKPNIKKIICYKPQTWFKARPSFNAKDNVKLMPLYITFTVVKEIVSRVYGDYYCLSNGYYVAKDEVKVVKE